MKVLLDTCTFVWLCAEPEQLSERATRVLNDPRADLCLSDVSKLEISLMWTHGHIELPQVPRMWLPAQIRFWQLATVPITPEVIYRSTELPDHHPDPFDRLLAATAADQGMSLMTPDAALKAYPISCIW